MKIRKRLVIMCFTLISIIYLPMSVNAQSSNNEKINDSSISTKFLDQCIKENKEYVKEGNVADYIPALKKADKTDLGISFYDIKEKKLIKSGETEKRFAIESVSKLPAFLLAMKDLGEDEVLKKIGTEATGFPFNSVLDIQINNEEKPMNPFINAGAITITSLVKGKDINEKFNRILQFICEICDDDKIYLNDNIWKSENETGDNNRSIAYYLKNKQMIKGDVNEILEVYFKQCSVMVNCNNLAKLGSVLANDGVAPWNNKRLISSKSASLAKSVMLTSGLYDGSGDFSVKVGVPTKSGVGGGLVSSIPKKYGIGVFGPSLDKHGNSIAGVQLLAYINEKKDISIFK